MCISLTNSRSENLSLNVSSIEIQKVSHITLSLITKRIASSPNITRSEQAQIISSISFIIYQKKSSCLCSYILYTFIHSLRYYIVICYCLLSQKRTMSRSKESLVAYQTKSINDESRKNHRSKSIESPKLSKTRRMRY